MLRPHLLYFDLHINETKEQDAAPQGWRGDGAARTLRKAGARGEAAAVERIAFVSVNAGFTDLL
jgi:hypothetical protein